MLPFLNDGQPLRSLSLDDSELAVLKALQLITLKPLMYIANIDETSADENPHFKALQEYANAQGTTVVPIVASLEAEIAQLEPEEQKEFLESLEMDEPWSG